ncbi:glycine betaine ABC transporter substrate-binding protein [Salinarimonas soli]|uniref:Glycine betaine ABC transporter substrate-binding protein n=1 Tax=Salinarimonas soli TaxID=1638099 RepID=A0A5B2V7P3_9HYPH|nr:glycine betaine ABC transporter substrate-binding protein [Salinarimonas soli]KAA2234836.1 glycine betaine ABC transporter substrate-binding protein [Salinarimonas soli]
MRPFPLRLTLLAAALVASLAQAHAQSKPIVVGGKNFTEQLVLAEMTAQLLAAKGIKADKKDGLASALLRQAQENGEVDVYWEYTGTSLVVYNKVTDRLSPAQTYERVRELDGAKGLVWLKATTANNTYSIALQGDEARKRGLRTISDLAKVVESERLKLATDGEFARRDDGLVGLQKAYGFTYPRTGLVLMDPGLTYEALRQGRVETAVVLSTDGRVKAFGFATLEDDKGFFPSYVLAPVARKAALDANPQLGPLLEDLSGRLTEDVMRGLNAAVDVDKRDVRQVAADFLKEQRLVQ